MERPYRVFVCEDVVHQLEKRCMKLADSFFRSIQQEMLTFLLPDTIILPRSNLEVAYVRQLHQYQNQR